LQPVHVAELKKKTPPDEAKELLERRGRNYVSKVTMFVEIFREAKKKIDFHV